MKKTAGFFYILCRILFQAAGWLVLILAVAGCGIRIFDIDMHSLIGSSTKLLLDVTGAVGDVLEMDLSSLAVLAMDLLMFPAVFMEGFGLVILVVTFLGMYGFRFLQDHLAQRKPVYLCLVELTAEMTSWIAKMVLTYACFNLVFRGFSWLGDANSLNGLPKTVMGAAEFIVSPVMVPVILAACLGAVCLGCAGVCRWLDTKK